MFFATQKKKKKKQNRSTEEDLEEVRLENREETFENFLQGRAIIYSFTRGCIKKILRKTSHVFLEEMFYSAGRDCVPRELPRRSGRRVFSRMFSLLWVAYIGRFGRRPNSSFSGRMFDRSTPALLSRNEFKISSRRGRFCMPLSASLFFYSSSLSSLCSFL